MPITRREFVRGGVSAFTLSFAAPTFLSDIVRAQGRSRRNLVVLYLSGGNDALSTVIPYNDSQYYARRPFLAIPAANVLQIGDGSRRHVPRAQSSAHGTVDDLQSRPARRRSAYRLPEFEPLTFPGHRHLVDGRSGVAAGARLVGPVSGPASLSC